MATPDATAPSITWVSLSGLPDGCVLERAANPEDIAPIVWDACGDGCRRAPTTSYEVFDAFFDDSTGWIALVTRDLGAGTQAMVLAPADGAPVAAWRYRYPTAATPYCRVRYLDVRGGWAAMVVNFIADDAASVIQDRIYAAPVDSIGATDSPFAVLDAPDVGSGVLVDEIAVGSGIVVTGISGRVLVVRDGSVTEAFARTSTGGGYNVAAGGDHAVFAETVSEWRLHDWTPENGAAVYYDPTAEVGQPRVDGVTLAWIQYADFVGGTATRAELWRSSFARNGADLAPALVDPDVEPNYAAFGDGIYGWYLPEAVRLIDVASGTARMLSLPAGISSHPNWLYYVSQGDVLISGSPTGGTTLYTYRLDPRALAM